MSKSKAEKMIEMSKALLGLDEQTEAAITITISETGEVDIKCAANSNPKPATLFFLKSLSNIFKKEAIDQPSANKLPV